MSKKEPKVKVINDLVATIMKLGVNFAEKQVEKRLEDPAVEKGVNLIFPLSKDLIDALSDTNPENAKQVEKIMLAWTNVELANYLEEIIGAVVAKQKDKDLKEVLEFVATLFIAVVRILSDNDANNTKQLKAHWEKVSASDEMQTLILHHIIKPILMKSGANGEWIDLVMSVTETALKGLIAQRDSQKKLIDQVQALK